MPRWSGARHCAPRPGRGHYRVCPLYRGGERGRAGLALSRGDAALPAAALGCPGLRPGHPGLGPACTTMLFAGAGRDGLRWSGRPKEL